MIDKIIVTFLYSNREFDMELPANIKIALLKIALANAFKHKAIHLPDVFQLESKGFPLKDTSTLFENGIWDGSYLKIV